MTALFINVKPEECPGQGPVRRDRGLTGIPFRGTGTKEGVGSKLFDHVMRSCLLIAMSSMMRSWRMRTWRRTSQLLGGTVAWFGTTQACLNPRHATPSYCARSHRPHHPSASNPALKLVCLISQLTGQRDSATVSPHSQAAS